MLWAQVILLSLSFVVLLNSANRHGKVDPSPENFWVALAAIAGGFILNLFAGTYSHIIHWP
jgi:hypothetical protein